MEEQFDYQGYEFWKSEEQEEQLENNNMTNKIILITEDFAIKQSEAYITQIEKKYIEAVIVGFPGFKKEIRPEGVEYYFTVGDTRSQKTFRFLNKREAFNTWYEVINTINGNV